MTPTVTLESFAHPAHGEPPPPVMEIASTHAVSFVECGPYPMEICGRRWSWTPQKVFVSTPGLAVCWAHRCHTVSYTEAGVDRLCAQGAAACPSALLPLTNRHAYLRQRLVACGPGDEARFEALAGALYFALTEAPTTKPLIRRDRLSWYAARVARACELMDASYDKPLSLSAIASVAGISPFHFARVFRELEGVPPHRYLTTVRLTQAARRLRDGCGVTDTCFAVGFGSLSHFITAFRRQHGVSPSTLARTGTRSA